MLVEVEAEDFSSPTLRVADFFKLGLSLLFILKALLAYISSYSDRFHSRHSDSPSTDALVQLAMSPFTLLRHLPIIVTVALSIIAASYAKLRTNRVFFYVTAAINMTTYIAYFTIGSHLVRR